MTTWMVCSSQHCARPQTGQCCREISCYLDPRIPSPRATISVIWNRNGRQHAILSTSKVSGHRSFALQVLASGKPGGGVLDTPRTAPPLLDPDQDVRKVRQKKKPRFYKVMLHNDSVNRREYVVRVLLKVVKGLTVEDAVNVMQHAHMYGTGCVIACAQEEAERYCEGLRSNGLISTVEPAGYGSGNGDEPST